MHIATHANILVKTSSFLMKNIRSNEDSGQIERNKLNLNYLNKMIEKCKMRSSFCLLCEEFPELFQTKVLSRF